eukprot:183984-Hanusia_phi.AAC.1
MGLLEGVSVRGCNWDSLPSESIRCLAASFQVQDSAFNGSLYDGLIVTVLSDHAARRLGPFSGRRQFTPSSPVQAASLSLRPGELSESARLSGRRRPGAARARPLAALSPAQRG